MSRYVFRSRSRAQQRIDAVRKRVESWRGKPHLGTEDPMLIETQMAQLDALLSIAHSMAALEARITVTIDESMTTWKFRDQEKRIAELRREMEELMVLVQSMHGTQIIKENKPSWWDRIFSRRSE